MYTTYLKKSFSFETRFKLKLIRYLKIIQHFFLKLINTYLQTPTHYRWRTVFPPTCCPRSWWTSSWRQQRDLPPSRCCRISACAFPAGNQRISPLFCLLNKHIVIKVVWIHVLELKATFSLIYSLKWPP